MDIVLEAFDTYLFDPIYATLLPSTFYGGKLSALGDRALNSSLLQDAVPNYLYHYKPASEYLSFPPSDYAYMSSLTRDNVIRQAISLYLITALFGFAIYFVCASLSYIFVFDKTAVNHPKYLKNQMRQEIQQAMVSLPLMAFPTVPFFLLEVRGYSKMYDSVAEGPGWWYTYAQFPIFIAFTDFCIYFIHRGLHHPWVYKTLHKPHHKWIMPTPFASHAFHPLDGFAQGVPYHVFPFLFPLQKFAYVGLFVFINIWTVMIHDGEYVADSPIINGAACHTMHHLYFNYNYGQFTTLWDRLGGSYRKPNEELFRRETKLGKEEWERQKKEMEKIVKEVEGGDDRTYVADEKKAQ
ncbi:C-5 sterol desaturas-like protein [Aulographum hederae CBS 113979]|uniref:C-5 sterol desaturas-like protein n=1 Tax=Aulographum hederae CBS 113979 TaxID=1176131 RepID=A0A6G1GLL4_9PEZI|nr:C-5 sterol desaturas-like protein [Aulographum hederae CBS 113979]